MISYLHLYQTTRKPNNRHRHTHTHLSRSVTYVSKETVSLKPKISAGLSAGHRSETGFTHHLEGHPMGLTCYGVRVGIELIQVRSGTVQSSFQFL